MKAYEFPVKVKPDGNLDFPIAVAELLPRGQVVRIIILVNEPKDEDEQLAWARLTSEQFLAGYNEVDSIYDKVN
jgi:hypothetical protein